MADRTPLRLYDPDGEPNAELARRDGWRVASQSGRYCVAWRGRDEVVLEWRSGDWHPVTGTYREAG
jgi:hypothetical protein